MKIVSFQIVVHTSAYNPYTEMYLLYDNGQLVVRGNEGTWHNVITPSHEQMAELEERRVMATSKQKPNEIKDGKAERVKKALKKVTKQAPKPKPKSK